MKMRRLPKEKLKTLVSTRYGPIGSFVGLKESSESDKYHVEYVPFAIEPTEQFGAVFGAFRVKRYPHTIFKTQMTNPKRIPADGVPGVLQDQIWITHDNENWFLDGLKIDSFAEVERITQQNKKLETRNSILEIELAEARKGMDKEKEGLKRELARLIQKQEED